MIFVEGGDSVLCGGRERHALQSVLLAKVLWRGDVKYAKRSCAPLHEVQLIVRAKRNHLVAQRGTKGAVPVG